MTGVPTAAASEAIVAAATKIPLRDGMTCRCADVTLYSAARRCLPLIAAGASPEGSQGSVPRTRPGSDVERLSKCRPDSSGDCFLAAVGVRTLVIQACRFSWRAALSVFSAV